MSDNITAGRLRFTTDYDLAADFADTLHPDRIVLGVQRDSVLVLTEWSEFVDLDPDDLAGTVRAKVVVDGRNCLDVARWQSADWRVHCLGRRVA